MGRGLQIPGIEPVFENKTTGLDKAMEFMNQGKSAAGSQTQNIPMPGKTVGGAVTSGLAGAGSAAAIGSAMGAAAGPVGIGAGSLIGMAGYYLS